MSEWKWIDRREREPKPDEKALILFCDGDIECSQSGLVDRFPWSHWMPVPPPPPKMVTIEISEEAAWFFANSAYGYGSWGECVGAACRKALEGK